MLRGGGACVSQRPQQSLQASQSLVSSQFEQVLTTNVQFVFKNAEDTQSNYKELYNSFQALLMLDFELNNLMKSQNQLNKQIVNLEKCLTSMLESCLLLKNSQLRFYAIRFSQMLSRTIFWHYCQAKTIKDGMQQAYNTLLNKIETINNTEDSFYKNLIEYEIQLCKMIFTILPSDFQEGLEVIFLFTSMNSILMNLLPKTMRETIKGGIVHSIRDATKVQYRKIYKQIFNIDVLKQWVINQYLQNTHSLKEIMFELQELQNQLTKSDYYVQQAWVIAISEIVSYAPTIQEESTQLEQSEIANLVQIGCLTKIKDEYKIQINVPKLKDTSCQGLQEKYPQFSLLKQIQQQIITKDRFFNQLYDNKEEMKESLKQETQIQTIFEYLFSLFTDSDLEINVDLIRKVNSQYDELKENISLIKQISLSKWIRMLESKSFNDSVVFGEFEQKQKQIKHLMKQVKSIQSYFINIDFIFQQWGILEQIVDFDAKQTNLLTIITESKQHLLDCAQINKLNQENLKDLQLLNINFDVYFSIITEFIERQYSQVYAIVATTQSSEPILTLYKQYKDVQDIVQTCFRKVNDKILQFKEFFQRISERFKQLEYNCIIKFYHVLLKLQHQELPNQQFEFRNSDHQILNFVQNFEKQVIKYQLIELHREFKEYVTSSQFQDYEQAKIYLKTIQYICKSMENILNQNKKLLHHVNNYKLSLQIDQTNIFYNDLLNLWAEILQITQEIDSQHFDQSVFSVKYDQIYLKYQQIVKQNQIIRWPINQYLSQYFKLLQQLDTIFQELKTFKQYDINSDQIAQNRFDSLKLNLKQICQSQVQRIKSTFEQYIQGVDQLQSKLESKSSNTMDELSNLLINMQEALEDTLTLIQNRISQPGSQQNVGALNLIQNHRLQDFENLYNYKFNLDTITIAFYIKFNFNFIERNAIQEALKLDQLDAQDKHVVQSGIHSAPLRIVMIINLITVWNCCMGDEEYNIISKLIIDMRLNETNQVIKKEIKTTFKQEYNFIIGNTFVKQLKNIEDSLTNQIQERNQLSFQIKYEPSFEISQQLNEKLIQHTEQISTIFTNLKEIGEEFDIEIGFYNQLMYEFKKADQSTSTLDVSEIKFYQGRQLTDLFLLRMGHVSRTIKTQQVKNCYVQLECQKKNEIRVLFSSKENKNGIIDKFLEDQQQEKLLLLQGDAGTGKSMAIKMIEEYVWKRNDAIKIIPIIIKLSELKDPINNAINETLRSLSYKFDPSQIESLQKDVKQDKVQMLFIFEEYDKLNQDQISINLFKSNNLNQWKTTNQQNSPRFIVVTRSELFKYSHHLRWIDQAEKDYNYQNYWNIKLLPYDVEQRNQFLIKYQELNIRNTVIDYYQMICEFTHPDLLISNFINLWKKIDLNLNELSVDNVLLSQPLINKIINALKNDQKTRQIDEFILKQLQYQLESLKSCYFYQRMLDTLNFQQPIDNPQILQIFIVSLPKLLQALSDMNRVKKDFYNIFLNENYAINCDTKLAKIQLERDWNLLANSSFFKNYRADESITKTQILLTQSFNEDSQNQSKFLKTFERMAITHYDLYEQYVENFFEIARLRVQQKEKNIDADAFQKEQWNFSMNLAQKLSYHEIFSVHFNSQGSLIKVGGSVTDWEEFFSDDDYPIKNTQIPKQTIRDSIPLKEQFSIFSFESKIIQEFLVAKAIILQLESMTSQPIESVLERSILKVKNISNPFFQGTVNFIVQKSKLYYSIKQSLLKLILLSQQSDPFSLLSSNAFYLLQNIEPVIKGIDFSKIKINDIHLEQCQLNNCNLEGSEWNNVSANSLVLISNNMNSMRCSNFKLNAYACTLAQSQPLYLRQFKSGNQFIVFNSSITTLQGNQILSGKFEDSHIDELNDNFYLKTKQKLYKIKEQNDQIVTEQFSIPNVLSISQFDQIIMLFQLHSKTEARILELNSKTNEIKFEIPIKEEDVDKYNVKQFYQMKGNQIIFLTHQQEVQSMNYQIENGQLIFDNLSTHAKLENDDEIIQIQYFNTLDITVVSFRNQVNLKQYDLIFGTINQLVGRFIWMDNKRQSFLFLNGQKIQLINQETFKMINECELINIKSDLLHDLSYQTENTSLLSFVDGVLVLSFCPFEVIKYIQVNPIDISLNQKQNLFQILTDKEILFYDFKYLEDKQSIITNQTVQFEQISFVSSSADFLAKIKHSDQVLFAQYNKKELKFQNITNSKESKIFLSNDENTAIVSDKDLTIVFDMKNNKQTQIVNLQYDQILWVKDHQNFYYMNQGFIEEFRGSQVTIKNKIVSRESFRTIKSIQSTNKKLYLTTSNSETIILNEQYLVEEITMKLMIKKYKDYYITDKDLRLENSKKNTITILYKTPNKLKDFWVFEDTILLKEQDIVDDAAILVLLDKQHASILAETILQIDQIAYSQNSIQIISNKTIWLTYSAIDLILIQQMQLSANTLYLSSNSQNQLAIVSQFSEITIWDTLSYQVIFSQKNVELIQYFQMVPQQENSYYIADRDVLKLYIDNQIKFSVQLSKKRIQIAVIKQDAHHYIYQIEEDKVILNCMNENNKILSLKKVVFELDCQREIIDCFDNKDHRLIFFAGSKIQQAFLDAFDEIKFLEIPKSFKGVEIKYNKDCSMVYIRSTEKIVIVEAGNLNVTKQVIFKEIIPPHISVYNQLQIITQGLNNILISLENQNNYFIFNYSVSCEKLDLIAISKYAQFIGTNSNGLVIVDGKSGVVELYQQKIIDPQIGFASFQKVQQFNKSNLVRCEVYDNQLEQCSIITEKGFKVSDLWKGKNPDEMLLLLE